MHKDSKEDTENPNNDNQNAVSSTKTVNWYLVNVNCVALMDGNSVADGAACVGNFAKNALHAQDCIMIDYRESKRIEDRAGMVRIDNVNADGIAVGG